MHICLRIAVRSVCFLVAATLVPLPASDQPLSVAQLVELVRSSMAKKRDDKQVAKTLSKVSLAERLEPVVVEHLESEGAGPRTLEELSRLVDETAEFQPPTPPQAFPHPLIPSREEMTAAIHHAREFAFRYAASLPDFICDENVVRYENVHGGFYSGWQKRDELVVRLSIEDGKENDKLVTYNGRPTQRSLEALGGAQTTGEFGAMMIQILDPARKGRYRWDHWTLLRNRPTQVYSYRIEAADSAYALVFGTAAGRSETIPAMEGMLYLDGETNDIVRIANRAADIDTQFPVRQAWTTLDYAAQEVGGKSYILPLRAETRLATETIHTRNMTEFARYRKFEGESSITFGDEAPPAGKIKH